MDEQAVPYWQFSDEELAALLVRREEQARRDYADRLALVAEAEDRALAANLGYRDGAKLLAELLNLSRHDADRRVVHAAATMGSATVTGAQVEAPMPKTGVALSAGEIGSEHVTELHKVLSQVSGRVDRERYEQSEADLVALATQANPAAVRKAGRYLLAHVNQDGTPPQETERDQNEPQREFVYHYTRNGSMRFTGRFDPQTAEQLEGLFGALAKPVSNPATGEPDPRLPGRRQGDALAEIIDLAARADDAATQGGERAALTVTVSLSDLQEPVKTGSLVLPDTVSAEALRRLACDAKVIPAVLGTRGEVLDVGRSSRLATSAQRHALVLRDRGCAFPGCDRGPKWVTPHHIVHWVHGGPTDLDNLVLLCGRHHNRIHHSGWDVSIHNGLAEFYPPGWLDVVRTPRHNRSHHPLGQPQAA